MSAAGDAIKSMKDLLRLTDDVSRAGETLKQLRTELREHDRRITRLEAQWDTALQLSRLGGQGPKALEKP